MHTSPRWILLPLVVAVMLFAGGVADSGFVADDAFNLAEHANDGDWSGEWTTPTYLHAGGERGHIWRPLPAWVQHVAASTMGRTGSTFRGLNVVIHATNVLVMIAVARRLGASAAAAALAALFWTTHPVMPEAICWSSDIYDLMATTFAMLAVASVAAKSLPRRRIGIAAAVVAACLCKESSVALVPALALVAWTMHGRRSAGETGILGGAAVAAYAAMHGEITAQSYADVARDVPLKEALDALLMNVGWWIHAPSRAPMAHLFDRIIDRNEVLTGATVLAGMSVLVAHQVRHAPTRAGFLLAGLASAVLLSVPAAVGIPFIGVAPLRYAYAPMAVGLTVAAARWTREIPMPWVLAVLLVAGLGAARVSHRVPAFHDDASLWAAERSLEPANPYAAGNLARAMIGAGQSQAAIALWADAIERAPSNVRVFDKANERWLLAQTAFLKGRPDVSLQQTLRLLDESGEAAPAMAHCLHADSLDALGRHAEAADVAHLCEP